LAKSEQQYQSLQAKTKHMEDQLGAVRAQSESSKLEHPTQASNGGDDTDTAGLVVSGLNTEKILLRHQHANKY